LTFLNDSITRKIVGGDTEIIHNYAIANSTNNFSPKDDKTLTPFSLFSRSMHNFRV